MVQRAEALASSPTLKASLARVRSTILPQIIRYNGITDNQGRQETVLDHVNGMKRLSGSIRQKYPHLSKAINLNEVDIMADLHDSGEANLHGDLSRGRQDYDQLRAQYDAYEQEYKESDVFPLFSQQDRVYVEDLDDRFEHREGRMDKEGFMTRVLDKAQPLTIFDRGFIVKTLKTLPHYANLSPQEFDTALREHLTNAFTWLLEPGESLFGLLASNPAAQQELLFFMYNDILGPMAKKGYSNEVEAATGKVFGKEDIGRRRRWENQM